MALGPAPGMVVGYQIFARYIFGYVYLAIAVSISTILALTLTPALAAALLKAPDPQNPDQSERQPNLGERLFAPFNRGLVGATTSVPIASTMPNRVRRLMLKPRAHNPRQVPISVTGITMVGISNVRQLWKIQGRFTSADEFAEIILRGCSARHCEK